MKRILNITAFVLLISSLSISCKDPKSQTEVIVEYPLYKTDMMEIDTTNIDSLIIRETDDFPTALDGELAKHNTNKSLIKSAKLTGLRIQMLDHDYNDTMTHSDFGHLSEIFMDVKESSLGQKQIAYKSIPNQRTKAVNMILSDVELKDYLQKDAFRMVIKYRKRKSMPNDLPFYIVAYFKIIADPL